jgi:hypothetical protein
MWHASTAVQFGFESVALGKMTTLAPDFTIIPLSLPQSLTRRLHKSNSPSTSRHHHIVRESSKMHALSKRHTYLLMMNGF